MTVEEKFKRIDLLEALINAKLRQISSLRDTLSIAAPPTDAERVSHTRNVHSMTDRIDAIIDAEREADEMIDELVNLKKDVYALINKLTNSKQATYITERFIEGKKTVAIAKTHGYTQRRVEQVIKDGIDYLEALEKSAPDFAGFRQTSP